MMKQGTPNVRTASKDILARLLASEDLIVQHSEIAETACFNTQSRILTLPVWENMDNAMYDMLVGHEVSHALHTPSDGWLGFIGEGKDASQRQMVLNVCEDVRIERLIKKKFPGLRRDFSHAYKSLHDRDIFQLKDRPIADQHLIDRINLYYKGEIYGQATIPFSTEEREWLKRLDAANTFEEITAIAEDLADKVAQDQEENEENDPQSGAGEEGEGTPGTGVAGNDDSDGDNEQSGSGSAGDPDGEDCGQSIKDDTDDGESADSRDSGESGESGDAKDPGELTYDSYSNDVDAIGSSQRNYENAVSDMRDNNAAIQRYYTVSDINIENVIVGFDKIANVWEKHDKERTEASGYSGGNFMEELAKTNKDLRSFLIRIKPIVNHMVQQFQQKQAADADKRSHVAKTGVLDTTTMINYRWSEDIFLKNEVHPDGKSHGMIIYIDWSGSMSNILQDTVEQLLVLVEFCRAAGIPYEVYAFSSNRFYDVSNVDDHNKRRDIIDQERLNHLQWKMERESDFKPHEFSLFNFLSSKMNASTHKSAVSYLYRLGNRIDCYRATPREFSLGGTPLNEAVISAFDIVPQFQNDNNVQIANVVFLTDGDAHGSIRDYSFNGKTEINVRDSKTRKTYKLDGRETDLLINILKDRTDATLISIRLHDKKNLKSLRYRYWNHSDWSIADKQYENANIEYRKNNFCVITDTPYDDEIIVMGELKVETDAFEELPEDASNTRIKNAFMKGGNRKKSSRVIATRLVDYIAVS
jgi:hypothetical protein